MTELERTVSSNLQSKEVVSADLSYQPPQVVVIGKAKELIRGAYASGYRDSTHDWYSTGE